MIKLFTHSDFDGVGCAILGKLAFEKDLDYEICDYENINEKVLEFLSSKDVDKYDKVYITDISVNEEVVEIINKGDHNKFLLLDHHKTATWLNKYEWANVVERTILLHQNNEPIVEEEVSGTYLFFVELLGKGYLDINYEKYLVIKSFCDTVRRYDTWLWKNKYGDIIPKQWNDLFYIMGKDEFIENMVYRLNTYNDFGFSDFDLKLLQYEQRKINCYIEKKNKEIIVKDILGYKAGIIFGEQYHSELGNRLCELNPELEFVVIINISKAVSYRSISNKVDLGKDIAKVFNGGGHPNSAGSPIADDIQEKIVNMIFNK